MSTSPPKLTIGIPVYNEERFLTETIQSAVDQTYPGVKIFISDNASTDGTWEIIQGFANQHEHITAIRHETGMKVSDHFKYVMAQADTPYVSWLGGHDTLEPDYAEKLIAYLEENEEVVLAYPTGNWIDRESKVQGQFDSKINTIGMEFGDSLYYLASSLFDCNLIYGIFRTPIVQTFPVDNIMSPDHVFLYRTAIHGKIGRVDFPGLNMRVVREPESWEEYFERNKKAGLAEGKFRGSSILYGPMAWRHFRLTMQQKQLPLGRRLTMVYKLRKCFKKRFNLGWLDLLRTMNK